MRQRPRWPLPRRHQSPMAARLRRHRLRLQPSQQRLPVRRPPRRLARTSRFQPPPPRPLRLLRQQQWPPIRWAAISQRRPAGLVRLLHRLPRPLATDSRVAGFQRLPISGLLSRSRLLPRAPQPLAVASVVQKPPLQLVPPLHKRGLRKADTALRIRVAATVRRPIRRLGHRPQERCRLRCSQRSHRQPSSRCHQPQKFCRQRQPRSGLILGTVPAGHRVIARPSRSMQMLPCRYQQQLPLGNCLSRMAG